MLSSPKPSVAETFANQSFDALLGALSRPGLIRSLPGAAVEAIVAALLDRECRVHCADPVLLNKVMATGALISDLPEADHVFLGPLQSAESLMGLCMGSDLYPDDGATVVVPVTLNAGQTLRLTGPGIETHCDVAVSGLPDGFWQLRDDLIRFPMGFDLFLTDGTEVLGVPRSTMVEVL
jgi:alpha-D-ribose 1-methylphosphonate 5-triphosphate synthase subunit PhnH